MPRRCAGASEICMQLMLPKAPFTVKQRGDQLRSSGGFAPLTQPAAYSWMPTRGADPGAQGASVFAEAPARSVDPSGPAPPLPFAQQVLLDLACRRPRELGELDLA